MLNFKSFISEAYSWYLLEEEEKSDSESDDKGKMFELLLAKHMQPGEEENKTLPEHFRAESDNPDHSGSPDQVHKRLREKLGDSHYEEINNHAREMAKKIKEHLIKHGHITHESEIANVHWTSNPDKEKTAGDHETLTGQKDLNAKADIMLTLHKKDGTKTFHGISAKIGSSPKPNLANDGLESLETKSKLQAGALSDLSNEHHKKMEQLGYTGSQVNRHNQYKQDKKVLTSEFAEHKKKGLHPSTFVPSSDEAKRAFAAENSSKDTRARMAQMHANALSSMSQEELKQHLKNQSSAKTIFPQLIVHAHTKKKKTDYHVHDTENYFPNMDDYDIHVGHSGISTTFHAVHKKTGKKIKLATQTFKATSGPHKGIAGFFKLG